MIKLQGAILQVILESKNVNDFDLFGLQIIFDTSRIDATSSLAGFFQRLSVTESIKPYNRSIRFDLSLLYRYIESPKTRRHFGL